MLKFCLIKSFFQIQKEIHKECITLWLPQDSFHLVRETKLIQTRKRKKYIQKYLLISQ